MSAGRGDLKYEFIKSCVPGPGVNLRIEATSLYEGCVCTGRCKAGEVPDACTCSVSYEAGALLKSEFLLKTSPPVFECNSCCSCSAACPNRITQRDSSWELEIFETEKKGLGLRSLNTIPKGSYVTEYVGEIISMTEGRQRLSAMDKEAPCYIMTYKEHTAARSLVTTIDATHKGNLARFINHSCSPNLVVVPVRSDSLVPRLCLFACQDVKQGDELTFSYFGATTLAETTSRDVNYGSKPCWCGATNCVGYLPFEQ